MKRRDYISCLILLYVAEAITTYATKNDLKEALKEIRSELKKAVDSE